MKPKPFFCLALIVSYGLVGCSTPGNDADIHVGIGERDIRLPVKIANYHQLYAFIARHSIGGTVTAETVFKLAADSGTEIYSFDDPPSYLWVVTPHFFNGGIYDEIRGAQGNGDYYVLRPLARNFTSGNSDCGFELIGVGEGNALIWTSVNGTTRFVTSWHVSAAEHPETTYEWNGKFFEEIK